MASWAGDLSTPHSGVFKYCSNATDVYTLLFSWNSRDGIVKSSGVCIRSSTVTHGDSTVPVAAPCCNEDSKLPAGFLQLNLVEAPVGIHCSPIGVTGNARHHVEWCGSVVRLLHVALRF